MKGFIYETLNSINKEKMQVKESDGFMTLTGTFGVCGVRNNNQRVYGLANYKKMVEQMNERMKNESILGELEHPNSMNITLENVSHKIESISINEETGEVTGTIKLLNTPKGKIAQEIVRGGCELFISSRAMGDVDAQGNVTLEMLKTYDLVGTPGFSQARLKLNESQEIHQLCESLCFISDSNLEEDNDGLITKESADDTIVAKQNENNENNTMNENENLQEQLRVLENEITDLKAIIEKLSNKDELKQAIKEEVIDECQSWVLDEFSPLVENWVKDEFSPMFESQIAERIAFATEKWIVEQYSPEVQKWVVEQYSPEVQKWVIEQYSPEVQKWVVEQYSQELQTWMCEEFANGVQDWIKEEYAPELKKDITEAAPKARLQETLSAVDEMLKVVESNDNSGKKKLFESAVVSENSNEPLFIQNMPADARVKWNMAPADVKEKITRKARIYNFTNEGAIESFWAAQDFTSTLVTESNAGGYQDPWERRMRSLLRKRF